MKTITKLFLVISFSLLMGCSIDADYGVILRNGTIYDGSGSAPVRGDLAIKSGKIAEMGDLAEKKGKKEFDVSGLAVAPGFINMLSWATESLIEDGRSLSDIKQGVTLEVMGEGWSMGPLNEEMKKQMLEEQGDITFDITWTTLSEYLDYLVKKGVSTNVASFIGATTVRIYAIGYEDKAPTPEELEQMKGLVKQAMEEGALGLASALIYAAGFYAKTDELISLCEVVADYDGLYISHIRSEGDQFLEALDEFLTITRKTGVTSEIYHLKAAGRSNWDKLDKAIEKIESARAEGLHVTANMYTYTAGATGLASALPPWAHEGGTACLIERLKDYSVRERIKKELKTKSDDWENLYFAAGSPENILLVGFKTDELKPLTGKTLAEVAEMRGKSPEETAMDLVIEDEAGTGAVYFMMSEENVKKQIALPWVSFGSDAGSLVPEGIFLKSNPHPRAYGTFARLLGKYVREEKVIPLEEAIRKLTSLPARNLKIKDRGLLKPGYYADVVVFDPAKVQDHATFEKPHQLATGMVHVFVNGTQVLKDGEHTGAKPGMVVRGPGWKGEKE